MKSKNASLTVVAVGAALLIGFLIVFGIVGVGLFAGIRWSMASNQARNPSTDPGDVFATSTAPPPVEMLDYEAIAAELEQQQALAQEWDDEALRAKIDAWVFAPGQHPASSVDGKVLVGLGDRIHGPLLALLSDPANRPRLARELLVADKSKQPSSCFVRATMLLQPPYPDGLVPALVPFLEDESRMTRIAATLRIAMVASPEALPYIERALVDPDDEVAAAPLVALERYSPLSGLSPAALDRLFPAIQAAAARPALAERVPAVLDKLDRDRTISYYASKDMDYLANETRGIVKRWREDDVLVPREVLRPLFVALTTPENLSPPACCTVGYTARLIGMHGNPEDLPLLDQVATKTWACRHDSAVEGLFSYHGYHNFRNEIEWAYWEDEGASFTPVQRQVYALLTLIEYAEGDGFQSYFENTDTADFDRALACLKDIGAKDHAVLLETALDVFGRARPSANPEVRAQQIKDFLVGHPDAFTQLDERWQSTYSPLMTRLIDYIVAHPEEFDAFHQTAQEAAVRRAAARAQFHLGMEEDPLALSL